MRGFSGREVLWLNDKVYLDEYPVQHVNYYIPTSRVYRIIVLLGFESWQIL